MVAKTGRNELCPCGSGKKHKACCGGNNKPPNKVLTKQGLNQCFLKLVKDAGSVDIPCGGENGLDSIPKDEMLVFKYLPETDAFRFQVVKVEQNKILQPRKRIILPGQQMAN